MEDRTLLSAGDLDTMFGIGGKAITGFQGSLASEGEAAAPQGDGKIIEVGSVIYNSMSLGWGVARYSPDGVLDPNFGNNGTVVTTFVPSAANRAVAAVVQSNGRIVVAGDIATSPAPNSTFMGLVRYNPNGTLDLTFGNGGEVISSLTAGTSALALQPDGKIIVSLLAESLGKDVLVRYNTDGSLDATFGSGGTVNLSFGLDGLPGVSIQPDGKIIAVGFTGSPESASFAVARYDASGNLDPSFGSGGIVVTKFPNDTSDTANAALIQSDGKILVGGTGIMNGGPHFVFARYNPDGSLDPTFGTAGEVSSSSADNLNGISLQSNSDIVASGGTAVAGIQGSPGMFHFTLARYTLNGMPDSTFGSQGQVTGNSLVPSPFPSLVVAANDRIVLAGSVGNTLDQFALLGFTANGSPDRAFGTAGEVLTAFTGPLPSPPAGVVIQSDGKIFVMGTTGQFSTNFVLARYNTDGSLDATFGDGGQVMTDLHIPLLASATGGVLLPNGDILVVAWGRANSISTELALARYTPDGQLDMSFGNGGTLLTDAIAQGSGDTPVVVQPDGKILIAGNGLVRLNPDGSTDTTFVTPAGLPQLLNGRSELGLALQNDGRILLSATVLSGPDFLLRFNSTGSLDSSFGNGGVVMTPFGGKVQVEDDGRILVGGVTSGLTPFTLARYFLNGNLDTTFGQDGTVMTDFRYGADFTVQSDRKIVVGQETLNSTFAHFLQFL